MTLETSNTVKYDPGDIGYDPVHGCTRLYTAVHGSIRLYTAVYGYMGPGIRVRVYGSGSSGHRVIGSWHRSRHRKLGIH